MADVTWLTGPVRFLARFLRAYPLVQISTAAALWTPICSCLQYCLQWGGWLDAVDLATKGLGVAVSGAGLAGVIAFVLVGALQSFKRNSFRKRRFKATEIRKAKASAKQEAELKAQLVVAEEEHRKVSAAFVGMTPHMHMVLRRAVEERRSTVGVGGADVGLAVAARQLDDLGYVSFGHDYNGGRHSATLRDSVFKYLLANPHLVGSEAAVLTHRDKLKLP